MAKILMKPETAEKLLKSNLNTLYSAGVKYKMENADLIEIYHQLIGADEIESEIQSRLAIERAEMARQAEAMTQQSKELHDGYANKYQLAQSRMLESDKKCDELLEENIRMGEAIEQAITNIRRLEQQLQIAITEQRRLENELPKRKRNKVIQFKQYA